MREHQGELFGPEFDARKARAARDEAVERVESNAAPDFMAHAVEAVRQVAVRQATLTTDEVWERLWSAIGPEASAREPRVMGAVMNQARALGYVWPTEENAQSEMVRCHSRPKRVWRSLLWRG